jgi:hypothetical protein
MFYGRYALSQNYLTEAMMRFSGTQSEATQKTVLTASAHPDFVAGRNDAIRDLDYPCLPNLRSFRQTRRHAVSSGTPVDRCASDPGG